MDRKVKIWLVDDDEVSLSVNALYLKKVSPEVEIETFSNPIKAVEAFKTRSNEDLPGFLLSDFHMPELNGLEFFEQIHQLDPLKKCKLFLSSASSDPEVLEELKEHKLVDGILPKPITRQLFKEFLDAQVG